MRIVVQKFGGSSLAPKEVREEALARVREAAEAGYAPVVVVSAMGREGDPYATDTLLNLLAQVNSKASELNTDLLLACGEIISAVIFAEGLNSMGLSAVALTGWQSGIYTDNVHLGARVKAVQGRRLWELLSEGKIPVVAGFQGVTEDGAVTTLGRGGSDTTAAVLGVALKAERVEIYTDVDGVKTADPRIIPDAPTLDVLSYREVVELAHSGAKVLHPRAAEISMEEGIPIRILSVKSSQGGTTVGHGMKSQLGFGAEPVVDRVVTGVTYLKQLAQIQITGSQDFHSSGLAPEIFAKLAAAGVSVDLIYLSPALIAFVVQQSKAQLARNVLTPLGLNVKIKTGFAKVSVVGAGMHGVPGVMARIVGCLEKAAVPIFQTTDSHANISCLVAEEHIPEAVRSLYKEFNLDRV